MHDDPDLPSFDLIVATVDRTAEVTRLLDSLERQTYRRFRVLLVDQNRDHRLERVVAVRPGLDVVRLRSSRGLSRARNVALQQAQADVVAFPDDDCIYPPDLLERVAQRLAVSQGLDGLTGKAADADGRSAPGWASQPGALDTGNVWHRGISFAIFLRRETVARVGLFDEELGLGSSGPWSSGEETDYLIRAVAHGARIEYDPHLVVVHELRTYSPVELRRVGRRDGTSAGYILRKHRYPPTRVAGMLVRPLGGALLSVARGDIARAGFHLATLRGRIAGYRARASA